jgi:hypothetical protein
MIIANSVAAPTDAELRRHLELLLTSSPPWATALLPTPAAPGGLAGLVVAPGGLVVAGPPAHTTIASIGTGNLVIAPAPPPPPPTVAAPPPPPTGGPPASGPFSLAFHPAPASSSAAGSAPCPLPSAAPAAAPVVSDAEMEDQDL